MFGAHTSPLIYKLLLLKLSVKREKFKYMLDFHHNLTPSAFSDLFFNQSEKSITIVQGSHGEHLTSLFD